MEEWYCFKCKEKMEEKDIVMEFFEVTRFQPGIKCPKCGTAYLTENIVVDVLAKGEEELEAKF